MLAVCYDDIIAKDFVTHLRDGAEATGCVWKEVVVTHAADMAKQQKQPTIAPAWNRPVDFINYEYKRRTVSALGVEKRQHALELWLSNASNGFKCQRRTRCSESGFFYVSIGR